MDDKKSSPKIHDFIVRNSGIQANYSWKIINYFQLFVSEELVKYIVEQTNNYWRQKNNNNVITGTELSELYYFITDSFLITRNKKLSVTEYWNTYKDKLLRSDIFGDISTNKQSPLLITATNVTFQ